MLTSLKQEFLTAADCLVYTAFMGSLAKISYYPSLLWQTLAKQSNIDNKLKEKQFDKKYFSVHLVFNFIFFFKLLFYPQLLETLESSILKMFQACVYPDKGILRMDQMQTSILYCLDFSCGTPPASAKLSSEIQYLLHQEIKCLGSKGTILYSDLQIRKQIALFH